MTELNRLSDAVAARTARVGVIGLGYVGLPFAVEKAKVGFSVLGIDRNPERVAMVNRGENYIADVDPQELANVVRAGKLEAAQDYTAVRELDVIVICVPTPLTRNHTPELRFVEAVTTEVARVLRPGQLIALESTTYPGTTEEIMLPILERESGLRADQDFFLAHSPERVDPGNKRYTTKNTNKVVGAVGPQSLAAAETFYRQTIEHVVAVSSAKAAELVKVYENTFRAVNIALVNELAQLCDRMQLDVWEVLDAAFTKPFGIMPFYPGPGVGGHCIPIDPHYLEWKAKELEFETRFIALAGNINRSMPGFVRDRVHRLLNQLGKAPSRSRLLFLGLAYKKDVGDFRESPALRLFELLQQDGAQLQYHDPFVPEAGLEDAHYRSVALTEATVAAADVVVITTDHTDVDYALVARHAGVILDTRNVLRRRGIQAARHVEVL